MGKLAGEMVKECKGLPLAITVLGGVLATKHTLEDWKRVGVNIKSALKREEQKGNDGVTNVLESSYEDLPYNLKSCFLCLSQYPEDTEMKTTEIIQIWMAEGFVPSSVSTEDRDETMEDVAEEYLNELINRCMVQAGRKGHTGRVKTCRIHDLIRDLCLSKAGEEGFSLSMKLGDEINGTVPSEHKIRRISIHDKTHSNDDPIPSFLVEISPQVRSLSWFGSLGSGDLDHHKIKLMVNSLKLVRILIDHDDLPRIGTMKHIGNLLHLRFLQIGLSKFPTSISNLRFLQTLKLDSRYSFDLSPGIMIPNSLWKMEQLRHLYLNVDCYCESTEQQVGNFLNLHTLVNFPRRRFDSQQNLVKFTNVRKFVVVRAMLEIEEVLRSQAIVFSRLQSLSFTNEPGSGSADMEAVTRACPRLYRLVVIARNIDIAIWPSNLTKFVLTWSNIDESKMWTLAKLQSLKVLFLHMFSFQGKEMVFHGNDFPQLNHLSLRRLTYLKAWAVHEGGLPSLSCLEINDCKRLKSVSHGFHYLKQLKELRVKNMPGGFRRRMEKARDQWDGVSHAPCIYFH